MTLYSPKQAQASLENWIRAALIIKGVGPHDPVINTPEMSAFYRRVVLAWLDAKLPVVQYRLEGNIDKVSVDLEFTL